MIVVAGGLCEQLADEYDNPPSDTPAQPGRVPDLPRLHASRTPVQWQSADEPPQWPSLPESDQEQTDRLLRMMTSSDEEHEALAAALTLRCEAMIRSEHFAVLHRHLTGALMRDGELYARQVRTEPQRAELRYTTQAIGGSNDDSQAAA